MINFRWSAAYLGQSSPYLLIPVQQSSALTGPAACLQLVQMKRMSIKPFAMIHKIE